MRRIDDHETAFNLEDAIAEIEAYANLAAGTSIPLVNSPQLIVAAAEPAR